MKCYACIYYKPDPEKKTIGMCIYDTPIRGDVYGGGVWPIVYSEQVCGKFISSFTGKDYQHSFTKDINERIK